MARNGPTSLPVGEMTPIAPATMSSGSQLVNAKTTPPTTISSAPATSTRRRPSRSALVVSHSEMIVSPIERQGQDDPDGQRVQPGRREVEDEDDREEPVAEHAQRPHREQEPPVAVEPAETGDEAGIDARGGRRCHASRV